MSVGETPRQKSLLSSSTEYCEERLGKGSLYALLNREGERLFPDESFADLLGSGELNANAAPRQRHATFA